MGKIKRTLLREYLKALGKKDAIKWIRLQKNDVNGRKKNIKAWLEMDFSTGLFTEYDNIRRIKYEKQLIQTIMTNIEVGTEILAEEYMYEDRDTVTQQDAEEGHSAAEEQ